jgi:hypothetical protein
MQQLARLARIFSSPTVLIITVWSALLIVVAIGPIDYSNQPSAAVLAIVVIGISLFVLGAQAGALSFRTWLGGHATLRAPPADRLSLVVGMSSCAGIVGIGLIALDRVVLSGAGGGNAELLRCAPDLIDIIEIKRTPLLYLGYLLFSFGFASLVLFLLKGEQIRGWTAVLAQLSILSPIGYALLYAGRMPILFLIGLTVAAVLVRLAQGQRALPEGHYLSVKMIVLVLMFAVYSSTIWSSRQNFCFQMNGVVKELLQRMKDREAELAKAHEQAATTPTKLSPPPISHATPVNRPAAIEDASGKKLPAQSLPEVKQGKLSSDAISAADLGKMIVEGQERPRDGRPENIATLLAIMDQAWHVQPRGYVISAMTSGYLPPGTAVAVLSTYFYFSHGVRILDTTWRERDRFSPHWGVYEIGVLSPILRVFLPENRELASLKTELQSAGLHGFFPTVWPAAYIDFGAVGAVIYILVWGFMGGWSLAGSRRSGLVTPLLLLVFVLASILLSPVEGPLGIANSALVLLSMLVTGCTLDFANLRSRSSRNAEPRSSAF